MAFVEALENGVIDRFNGADHNEAAGIAEMREVLLVFAKMLDLDGDVVGDRGKFAMKSVDYFEGMLDAVEEIGIAERDMLRAGSDLLANVGEDDVAVHDAEDTFIDWHDGAMTAEMFAAAAGLGGANDAKAVFGDHEMGVLRDG